jgi:transposase
MAQNFVGCDREQELLLPPSLREWLPEGHLAWFVIDAVAQLDLSGFYAAYRADGHGRAAHDPAMMGALLLYAYAIGERSSQRIERRCVEDVACRVIAANQAPDHTTIARFRQRHKAALAELFGEVLALCAEAGLVNVGLLAIDGTKVHANASQHANRDYEQLAREILEEADAVDAAEDERFGDTRGDELPPELATSQAGAGGCARPSAGSMTSAPRRPGRFRARDPSGCGNPSAAWRRSTRSNAAPTPITRPTGRAG